MKMNENKALEIIDKIFMTVFNDHNHKNLSQILSDYSFDIKLPQEVRDSTTNEITWAESINPTKFITQTNMRKNDISDAWMLPKQELTCLDDILNIWKDINLMTTERVYDSINVAQSDTIYRSENIFRCVNCNDAKNMIFCDTCGRGEFLLSCQRSFTCNFCIRTDDSVNCSNCYSVQNAGKISNSWFIQDCSNLHECLFCAHISNKRFCIANMQFDEEEYYMIKNEIKNWILTN